MRVRFLPAAEIELLKEVTYYSNARAGTGLRFQAAVQAAVSRVSTHPLGGAPSFKETRSILVKGFPFSVV
jgi:toxin ParE1/3/4